MLSNIKKLNVVRNKRFIRSWELNNAAQSVSSSDTPKQDLVIKTVHENYAILQLNKPKVNSIDGTLLEAIKRNLKEVEDDPSLRGVIFTGLPGVYSAGFDLPVLSQYNREEMNDWFYLFNETLEMMALTRLVTVTAISGHAPAGGAVLSIATDYRIATAGKYKIGLNEVQVGIVVPPVILKLLHDVVGPRNCQYLAMTGKMISPEEAKIYGLVDEVVSHDDLLPRAQQLLSQWLNSTTNGAVRGTKELLRQHIKSEFDAQKLTRSHDWLDQWFSEETIEKRRQFNVNLKKQSKKE